MIHYNRPGANLKLKLYFIFLRCCLCLTCLTYLAACHTDRPSYRLQYQPLNEAIYAAGEILPYPYAYVEAGTDEILSRLFVQQGDVIVAGHRVAQLGAAEQHKQLQVLQQQLNLATAAALPTSPIFMELEEKINNAKQQYAMELKNADRYASLAKVAAVSQKDADFYLQQAVTARTLLANLQQQYQAKISDLTQVKLQIENDIAQADHKLSARILRSSISGSVLSVFKKEGESVRTGEKIALIGKQDSYMLNLQIDERDIRKVAVGQQVVFETDAYPNQQFKARISKVETMVSPALRTVKAEAVISGNPTFIPQATVEANIIVRQHREALLIPSEFLYPGDSIVVKKGKRMVLQKVTTGARSAGNIEIVEGALAGDVIFKKHGVCCVTTK
ncbi:efflux RND transporter periplasmic adaptor subunit [Sphingobacterium sp. Mn56C]|uniref:efflux RND transporter periplasmic adaptor subunit n=1 Tax=Sphingobacterium sp. Mn56C TaxID=3395261 RepID=UPI003BF4D3A5